MNPFPLDALRDSLARLGLYLTAKGGGLAWRGPAGLLTAVDRKLLAGAPRAVILAALEGREVLSPSAASPELIEAGPYAGFLAGPPRREPDPVRRAVVMLERLAYQVDTVHRDGRRRDAQAARTAATSRPHRVSPGSQPSAPLAATGGGNDGRTNGSFTATG